MDLMCLPDLFFCEAKNDTGTIPGCNEFPVLQFQCCFDQGFIRQYIAMYHKTNIISHDLFNIYGAVEVLIIIFFFIKGRKTQYPFPFLTDGQYAYPDILYLSRKCKRMQVLRLA